MENRPISRLTWDRGELYWKVWVQDHIKYVPFFQYSVKIGRKILGARSQKEPSANVFWIVWAKDLATLVVSIRFNYILEYGDNAYTLCKGKVGYMVCYAEDKGRDSLIVDSIILFFTHFLQM